MCPRGRPQGQGPPRGLHLCLFCYFIKLMIVAVCTMLVTKLTLAQGKRVGKNRTTRPGWCYFRAVIVGNGLQ